LSEYLIRHKARLAQWLLAFDTCGVGPDILPGLALAGASWGWR
jgi:hypothetical protein